MYLLVDNLRYYSFSRVVGTAYISDISLGIFFRISASRLLSIASGVVSAASLL